MEKERHCNEGEQSTIALGVRSTVNYQVRIFSSALDPDLFRLSDVQRVMISSQHSPRALRRFAYQSLTTGSLVKH